MQVGVETSHVLTIIRPRIVPLVRPLIRSAALLRILAYLGTALLLGIVVFSLAPERLFDFDAANFALALGHFQPGLHQPQPPGYPLYVGLTKLIHFVILDVWQTFLIAGVLGATASVLLIWSLGVRIFGVRSAIFSALLLLTNPILWQTAMTDQVRTYIAVVSLAVALAIWPGWECNLSARRLSTAAFVLGLLAGFRPEMLLTLAPLLLIAAIRGRVGVRGFLMSGLALVAGAAPWLSVLIATVGGTENLLGLMRAYSMQQSGGRSLFFGAGMDAALKMFGDGFWWLSLGLAAWVPALFAIRWRSLRQPVRGGFLLAWFLPVFVFSVAIHIAASGHALSFVPVECLVGGWALSAVGETRSRQSMLIVAALALTLNVVFFFKPYSKRVREASYKTVSIIGNINDETLARIDEIVQHNPTYIVADSQWVPWRTLEYYYPSIPVLYVSGGNPIWLIQNRNKVRDIDTTAPIQLPSCGTIVWLISDGASRAKLLLADGAEAQRYFVATPSRPGLDLTLGQYRFVTANGCGNKSL